MEAFGYIAAVLIGVSLGMVGSGGSILTVPALVYLMGVNPLLATTSSLFIVGATSLVGGLRAHRKRLVDFRAVTEFGFPSIFSIFLTRQFLLPALPAEIFRIGSFIVTKEMFLMLVFAILMSAAAITMISTRKGRIPIPVTPAIRQYKTLPLMLLGLVIGVVTGLLGAGGGFLIIPALVLFLRLPMKNAVGTSLFIIAINATFGFLFSLKQFDFDWKLLISFTVLAIGGIFIGGRFQERFDGATLRKIFGWFVLVMGVYIITRELF